ncbi:sodium/proton antiporter, NhaA family [Rhizobiales bacterium GAS191]|nr:sodium/proton antiporter, NhaA family [Rhizobiales bacterium GAS191]
MAIESASPTAQSRLQRPVDQARDHVRGGNKFNGVISVVVYGDYLCPYCRRLRLVIARLRQALGERLAYVFRHFPNEAAHPGATLIARASEAAAKQGRFWEMHDWLYEKEPPLTELQIRDFARDLGLDITQFNSDLESEETRIRVEEDLAEGKRNGVTGTPSFFIDGVRYDGAWDFHSMLEALQLPVAARVQRSARAFANLPASGGLVLLLAAAAALLCANTPLGPTYRVFIESAFGIGPPGSLLSMTVGAWFSEGLLAIFFLLVGLEIRREMTAGQLSDPRAAMLPVLAAIGGVLAPAAIYLALNSGSAAPGWSVPTATDIAFTLGILALLGSRVPTGLRVFVAALAVVDDVLSVLTLAIFYPKGFAPVWLFASGVAIAVLFALNRWRVYATWPYVVVTAVLWLSLHAAGVHGALAGIFLAAFLPTRPAPAVGPLLAQAATALAALEHAESEARQSGSSAGSIAQEPIWEWASRNLSAASERLLSPADRIERAVAPWSTYVILPLFAFSATGVGLDLDLSSLNAWRVLLGVILGLVIGKPLGISLASLLAVKSRLARGPDDVTLRNFIGAACLCGVGDTVALLMADQAFPQGADAGLAKTGVLIGSVLAAALGAAIIAFKPSPVPRSEAVEA